VAISCRARGSQGGFHSGEGGGSREGDWRVWRALDVESMEMQRRANEWAVDVRDGDLEVNIISSDSHCQCLTKVREECGQILKSKIPTRII
jgi:hypothetical protein